MGLLVYCVYPSHCFMLIRLILIFSVISVFMLLFYNFFLQMVKVFSHVSYNFSQNASFISSILLNLNNKKNCCRPKIDQNRKVILRSTAVLVTDARKFNSIYSSYYSVVLEEFYGNFVFFDILNITAFT